MAPVAVGQPTSPRAHTIDITSCSGHSPASRSLDSERPPPRRGSVQGVEVGAPLEGVRLTDRRREAIIHQSLPPTPPACRAPTCFLLLLFLFQLRLLLHGGTPGPCQDPAVWGSFPRLGPRFPPSLFMTHVLAQKSGGARRGADRHPPPPVLPTAPRPADTRSTARGGPWKGGDTVPAMCSGPARKGGLCPFLQP